MSKIVNSKYLWIFLVLLILAVFFRYWKHSYRNTISSDGKGYYAYLPAIFIYHDLDYEYFSNGELNIGEEYTSTFLFDIDGHHVIKYPAGVSLLQLPFFLLAIIFSFLHNGITDGYSFWFQVFVSIAAITYTVLGTFWTSRMLEFFGIENKNRFIISIALLFGTNLLVYTVMEPSMSHAYSFSMVALFTYMITKLTRQYSNSAFLWASFALGAIILIRPVNAIVLLAIPAFFPNFKILGTEFSKFIKQPGIILTGIIICLSIISIQPILWYLQNGSWYIWTYLDESFNFSHPEMYKVLFSYRKGWFIYTPLMFLIIPGLLVMYKKGLVNNAIIILIFSVSLTYLISSWWCWYYGGSFGQRSYIDFYPVFIVPLAIMLQVSVQKYFRIALITIIFSLVFINIVQSYQYRYNILHYDSMTRESYWKVFMKTSHSYIFSLFKNKNDVPDTDIADKILVRYFQDFESDKPYWKNKNTTAIADEALSGNRVIAFNKQLDPVYFQLDLDSTLAQKIILTKLRFTGWFKGDAGNLSCEVAVINQNDTLLKQVYPLGTIQGQEIQESEWSRKQIDMKLPDSLRTNSRIIVDIKAPGAPELYMDDATINIYTD